MLHVDIPAASDLTALIAHRDDMCVSVYLPTTPLTDQAAKDRIGFKNAAKQAIEEIQEHDAEKRRIAALAEELDDLTDDDEFWRFQARSLAVFATPDRVQTFRLPNTLEPMVEVADRFYIKPLLRSVTFPNACYVLAVDQGPSRLIDVSADLPPENVKIEGMPRDAASAVGKSSIGDRSPSGRIQGSEGQKVRLRQFARKVDSALRPFLSGSSVPLILAATRPMESIYRSVNTYSHLAPGYIEGSPADRGDADLAQRARVVLDQMYGDSLTTWRAAYAVRANSGRATSDVAQAARAATVGAVESMLVNMDEIVHGTVDDDGAVSFTEGPSPRTYGVVDEIAGRVILAGGRVLAVRSDDIPERKSLAAMLRYAV